MKNPSLVSFRCNIPLSTPASAPVSVTVSTMSRLIRRLTLHFNAASGTTHEFAKVGFRVKDKGRVIFPDNGSKDSGFTLNASEEAWLPLPISSSPVNIDLLDGYELSGPPYELTFEFYNTEAHLHECGGFVVSSEPVTSLQDFISEVVNWQKKLEAQKKNESADINASQYIKKQSPG